MKKSVWFILLFVFLMPSLASAGALALLDSNLKSAITSASSGLQTTAASWLAAFCLFQLLITGWRALTSGADI